MRKLAAVLCVLSFVLSVFIIFITVNKHVFINYLSDRYPDAAFKIESVGIDLANMEVTARVGDSDGIESTLRKKGSIIYSDYELDKVKSLIKNELTETLRESELMNYIKNIDVRILEKVEYAEIADGLNPAIYLTVEYSDAVSGKRDFAQKSYNVISVIKEAKYNNIGTYVFLQSTEHDAMSLTVYSEDSEADFDALLGKIEVVKEKENVQ